MSNGMQPGVGQHQRMIKKPSSIIRISRHENCKILNVTTYRCRIVLNYAYLSPPHINQDSKPNKTTPLYHIHGFIV